MLITTAGTILKGLWQGVLLWEVFIGKKNKPKNPTNIPWSLLWGSELPGGLHRLGIGDPLQYSPSAMFWLCKAPGASREEEEVENSPEFPAGLWDVTGEHFTHTFLGFVC